MEKIITLDAEVVADTKLVIEGAAEVKIDASKSITAAIAPDTYVLGSVGSFDTASGWVGAYVNELVRESIGTGGTLADALDLIRTEVMDEIELGVNQVITQVENEYVSNSTLATTLGSEIGGVQSSILNIENTYATQTQAQTYAIDAIKASFGGNSNSSAIEAYIGSIAVTTVDNESALAETMDVLIATVNDTSIRIDTLDSVEITPEGWSLGASKLATDDNNNIVGWQFSNGSNELSEFNILADHFKVASGTSALAPFRIDTVEGKVYFNAEVEFEGLGINGGSTTIDGGKITTGTVDANVLIAGTSISSPLIVGGTISGGTISGGTITGVNIVGSVIKSSWIDYTTTGSLTNWQYFTIATVPSAYAANFAHDNTSGALIEDAQGYVRLQGMSKAYSTYSQYTKIANNGISSYTWNPLVNVYRYDSYTQSSTNRAILQSPLMNFSTTIELIKLSVPKLIDNSQYITYTIQVNFMGNIIKIVGYAYTENAIGGGTLTVNGLNSPADFTLNGISFNATVVDNLATIRVVQSTATITNWDGSTFSGFYFVTSNEYWTTVVMTCPLFNME